MCPLKYATKNDEWENLINIFRAYFQEISLVLIEFYMILKKQINIYY